MGGGVNGGVDGGVDGGVGGSVGGSVGGGDTGDGVVWTSTKENSSSLRTLKKFSARSGPPSSSPVPQGWMGFEISIIEHNQYKLTLKKWSNEIQIKMMAKLTGLWHPLLTMPDTESMKA